MYIVVSYDIANDRRRRKIAKTLEDFGVRVQYSVFDCVLNEQELLTLQTKLQELIDYEEDSVRFYRLCKRCVESIEILGYGTVQQERLITIF